MMESWNIGSSTTLTLMVLYNGLSAISSITMLTAQFWVNARSFRDFEFGELALGFMSMYIRVKDWWLLATFCLFWLSEFLF
jgi:hypothetical protein